MILFALAVVSVAIVFSLVVPPSKRLIVGLGTTLWLTCLFGVFEMPDITIWTRSLGVSLIVMVIALLGQDTRKRVDGTFAIGIVWTVYVVFFSVVIFSSYSFNRAALFFTTALLVLYAALQLDSSDRRSALRILISIAVFQTIVSVWQVLLGGWPIWGYRNGAVMNPLLSGDTVRAQGTLGHPNTMAFVCVFALVAAISTEAGLKNRWRFVSALIIIGGIILTGTRLAIPAAVAGVVVYVALQSRRGAQVHRLIFLFIGLIVAGALLADRALAVVGKLTASGSWDQRSSSLQAIPKLLARSGSDFLFGSGYTNVRQLYDQGLINSRFGTPLIDNWFVYLLGTMGVVGLALFSVWVIQCLRRSDNFGTAIISVLLVFSFGFDIGRLLAPTILMFFVLGISIRRDDVYVGESLGRAETTDGTRLSVASVGRGVGHR